VSAPLPEDYAAILAAAPGRAVPRPAPATRGASTGRKAE